MAHQMNLVVSDIFKESPQYKQISKNAICIISYFHSSTYFTRLLKNEQMSYYGQIIALITSGETRRIVITLICRTDCSVICIFFVSQGTCIVAQQKNLLS